MRRPFAWVAGLVGIAALARLVASRQAARREAPALPPAPSPPASDPADELRRKLAESRDDPAGTALPSGPPPAEESLEVRRARVHAKAQETMETMETLQEPPT